MITVNEIANDKINEFLKLPYRLYKDDKNWVPPLMGDMKKLLKGVDNELFARGEHTMLLSYDSKRVTGRVLCGIDTKMKLSANAKTAYFSLFEAEDMESAEALMRSAESWCLKRGADILIGPWSPDDGEGWRGILIEGRDGPPTLMNAYTKESYPGFFDRMGYLKHHDVFAVKINIEDFKQDKVKRLAESVERKYGLKAYSVNLKKLEQEARDVIKIIERSYPEDFVSPAPTYEFVQGFIKSIISLVDKDIVCIVRKEDTNEPIAYVMALPDYNQVIKKMNGKLLPFGAIIFLTQKSKIDGVRVLHQFCVPEYQSTGAIILAYYHIYKNALKNNYVHGEASTIDEENFRSWQSVQGVGGEVCRRYRYYYKKIENQINAD